MRFCGAATARGPAGGCCKPDRWQYDIVGGIAAPQFLMLSFMRTVFDFRHDLTLSGRVGAELVGDQSPRWTALLFQQMRQQALGSLGVAPCLDDFIEHIAVLIDRPPQPVLLARDHDHDLIQVPDVAAWPLALNALGVRRPELQRPSPDSLIGNEDAALQQHLLNQPQAQWEPEMEPYRVGDDLGWKAVAFVADGRGHASRSTRLAYTFGLM